MAAYREQPIVPADPLIAKKINIRMSTLQKIEHIINTIKSSDPTFQKKYDNMDGFNAFINFSIDHFFVAEAKNFKPRKELRK